MNLREKIKNKKNIVVKIGTSSLSYDSGRINFQQVEKLSNVLSTLRKEGKQITLVSSGAIAVGAGRLGLKTRPDNLAKKQALAAIGQAELIRIYQKFFESYNQKIAQLLITKDIVKSPEKYKNAKSSLKNLLHMGIIPIINENDTIATYEIEFGDNDTLSAVVAQIVEADLLVMLSDIDGLYSADPKIEKNAKIISTVNEITPQIETIARGAGTSFSTGGMVTKLMAVKICRETNIDTIIMNGRDPASLYELFDGKEIGTYFIAS